MAAFSLRTLFQHLFLQVNYASASLTPGVLVSNVVNTTNTVNVPNAAIGDIVDVVAPASLGATLMQGEVTAAGVVTLKFLSNGTTAPPTGLYRVFTYTPAADFAS